MRLGKLAAVLVLGAWAWAAVPGFSDAVASVAGTATRSVVSVVPALSAGSAAGVVPAVSEGWASCGPVPFVVSVRHVPAEARGNLVREARRAFRLVSQASGVSFRFAGVVEQDAFAGWPASGPADPQYGFAPVLVSWVPVGGSDMLTAGQWGSTVLALQSSGRAVSAVVALNADELGRLEPGFGAGQSRGSVLLHELGHVVGLEHRVDGLMAPVVGPGSPAGFAEAELEELAAANAACR